MMMAVLDSEPPRHVRVGSQDDRRQHYPSAESGTVQSPRPCVATSTRPSGVTLRSAAIVCGRPTPTRFHAPPARPEAKTPTSSATTRWLPTIITSLAGASTRSPLMSCQQDPPLVDWYTW